MMLQKIPDKGKKKKMGLKNFDIDRQDKGKNLIFLMIDNSKPHN
jgi:hypothetical protein